MPITKAVSSRANAKQLTSADVPQQPTNMVTAKYTATSTASQTVINLSFAVDQTNTTNFFLAIDGRTLREGASNDFTFTNVAANNTSSQVTLNQSLVVGLNIQAWYLGLLVPASATTSLLSFQAQLNTQPTVQRFLSGSGTYTTPGGVKYIKVKMIGAGGGGGGAGGAPTTGGTGGTTTFGSSLLTATGGAGGTAAGGTGSGGTTTVNSPAITLVALDGGRGYPAYANASNGGGGGGGVSPFGGAGTGGTTGIQANQPGLTNTGSGGGGAFLSAASGAGGGAAGGYIEAIITSPSTTYSYAIGAAGTGGTGTNAGSIGGSGVIIVEEHYV